MLLKHTKKNFELKKEWEIEQKDFSWCTERVGDNVYGY